MIKQTFRIILSIFIISLLGLGSMTALAAGSETELAPSYQLKSGVDNTADFIVVNNDLAPHTYTLQADNVPDGISWFFTIASQNVTELNLQSSESAIVTLHLTSPATAAATTAQISVTAQREDGIKSILTVSFLKNSDYSLKITKTSDLLQVVAGDTLNFDIAVTNTGDKALTGLSLNLSLPYKWLDSGTVPHSLDLKPGESSTFSISVQPPVSQSAGVSTITVSVGNDKASSGELAIPVKVTSKTNFVLVLGGVALVIAVTAIIYFRRHGRR